MTNDTTNWTEAELAQLRQLADILIPGGAGMPPASAADLEDGIARISTLKPTLVGAVRELLDAVDVTEHLRVEEIRAASPDGLVAAGELLAGAYFLDPSVTSLLDYLDKPTMPLDNEDARVAELEALVRPVAERGNIWKTTP